MAISAARSRFQQRDRPRKQHTRPVGDRLPASSVTGEIPFCSSSSLSRVSPNRSVTALAQGNNAIIALGFKRYGFDALQSGDKDTLRNVAAPNIPNFMILGTRIGAVGAREKEPRYVQESMFR
jgi:hypothetical protein